MVCVACLLPLFLIPIVNALPLLFYYFKAKVYALFGWEYRKPERVPPACPYKPSAKNNSSLTAGAEGEPGSKMSVSGSVEVIDGKQD
ncbi:uncharacterized protein LOC126679884 isoform X2 [Mercurialis annua]|uniref:uncharacterized protein LOC126679884 isoform X2 n=1 Tax=Mercurialis annua TaxID=3986 RepID=UPI00215FBE6F|nr:uncharacterized protein LOC126679884 isoform X2 [Mercurialis annua]